MKTLTVILPLPDPKLSSNARYAGHWTARAKAARKARADAWLAATAAIRQQRAAVPFRQPKVFITYHHRVRRNHDQQNLLAWLKAAMDGLQDAGVVRDDKEFRFIFPIAERIDPLNPRLEIVVQEPAGADPQD